MDIDVTTESSLIDFLNYYAKHKKDETAYVFINDDESVVEWTFGELADKAQAIAAKISQKANHGDRALLLYTSGLDFIVAFYACLYAGVVAVPAYPPKKNQKLSRLQSIIDDCSPSLVLSNNYIMQTTQLMTNQVFGDMSLNWLASDLIAESSEDEWHAPFINSSTLAFLQYTSGSTGDPKGVMVNHGNIVDNLSQMYKAYNHKNDSCIVSWLPLFHDMGLIGSVLQVVYGGIPAVLMSPTSFLREPVRWLKAISDYKGTFSGAPNFAYDLCVDKITQVQLEGLDLSHWKVTCSAAEPVNHNTMLSFVKKFSQCGFKYETLYPCYGLAESTLFTTGGYASDNADVLILDYESLKNNKINVVSEALDNTRTVVSCGFEWGDNKVTIVDADTLCYCDENVVGEIWLSGPSVAQGYWGKKETSQKIFSASINGQNEGRYLRTGDLGFVNNKQLYITGRLKDMIIVRGRNYYPQDIELSVSQCHESLVLNATAAFSIDYDGEERLIVVQEVKRKYYKKLNVPEIISNIQKVLIDEHDISIHGVVLIKPMRLPKTSSGKVQRSLCKKNYLLQKLDGIETWQVGDVFAVNEAADIISSSHRHDLSTNNDIEKILVRVLSEHTGYPEKSIDVGLPFAQYGLDSVKAVQLVSDVEKIISCELPATLAYDYPNIKSLATYIGSQILKNSSDEKDKESSDLLNPQNEPIAIIGMECRFPGASNVNEFWNLLNNGVDAITEVPNTRWDVDEFFDDSGCKGKMKTRYGGFIDQVDQFDASFFNISAAEAKYLDPQQRLLLEISYEAIQSSGYASSEMAGTKTGVFIGASHSDYGQILSKYQDGNNAYTGSGNALSMIANRLSYCYDFKGPSLTVDTACSSSLSAIDLACQSLQLKKCEQAIVGAINLVLSPQLTVSLSQANMLSKDGRCKTFDAGADGYVRGEGCGVVILKTLSKAIANNDNILALIKGTAVQQDGRSNGLTAPNGRAQKTVIEEALYNAGVEPVEVTFVETHGTGTELGDPIEVNALNEVYAKNRNINNKLFIGAVKANIGHLEAAAGMAGLIKSILCIQNKYIPPQLHISQLNPHISWQSAIVEVPQKGRPWLLNCDNKIQQLNSDKHQPLCIAGVSSFGFGGTNAHVILSEHSKIISSEIKLTNSESILSLSARDHNALMALKKSYIQYLQKNQKIPLSEICYVGNVGRDQFDYRLAVSGHDHCQIAEKLSSESALNAVSTGIAFMFSGQGSQYVDMGKQLYQTQKVFTRVINQCADLLTQYMDKPLFSILWGDNSHLINKTQYTQPALFSLQVALAETWMSWGVKPAIVIGHSVGEYAAAYIAGVMSLEDAIHLIAIRGQLMADHCEFGSMLAVYTSKDQIIPIVEKYSNNISIAADNGPSNIVLSGKTEVIIALIEELNELNILSQKLDVSHAFHSMFMQPMLDKFYQIAMQVDFKKPCVSIVSNLHGREAGEDMCNAEYWTDHIRQTVQFAKGIKCIEDKKINTYLEIGPGRILLGMTAKCSNKSAENILLASLNKNRTDREVMLNSLSAMYMAGQDVDWASFEVDSFNTSGKKHIIPTYPFVRQKHWHNFSGEHRYQDELVLPPNNSESNQRDYLFYQHWFKDENSFVTEKYIQVNNKGINKSKGFVPREILIIGSSLSIELEKELLINHAHDAVSVIRVESLQPTEDRLDLDSKIRSFDNIDIIYFLSGINDSIDTGMVAVNNSQKKGVETLLSLIKSLDVRKLIKSSLTLCVVTNNIYQIENGEHILPWSAGLQGLAKSILNEYPEINVRCIDVNVFDVLSCNKALGELAKKIKYYSLNGNNENIALRNGETYISKLLPATLPHQHKSVFRKDGVYFILGGAGGIGLELAHYLSKKVQAKLVLIGRSKLCNVKKHKIKKIEDCGGTVMYIRADATDMASMRKAVAQVKKQFGAINGVVHSAIVLKDQLLKNMDETSFNQAYAPKVQGSMILHEVVKNETLDFELFFSSAQSFIGNIGQANYAAACTFKDSWANYLNNTVSHPVKVINWGYWGEVGVVANDKYKENLAKQGVYSINIQQGIEVIENILSVASANQLLVLKASQQVRNRIGVDKDQKIEFYPSNLPSVINTLVNDESNSTQYETLNKNIQLIFKELEGLSQHLLLSVFQNMGVFQDSNESYSYDELINKLNIIPQYSNLFGVLLNILDHQKYIRYEDNLVVVTDRIEKEQHMIELDSLHTCRKEFLLKYSNFKPHIDLLWNCIQSYKDVLQGRVQATDVIFPDNSMNYVEGVYRDNAAAEYYNGLLSQGVKNYIEARIPKLQSNEKIKILELGAGTGGSSLPIFNEINDYVHCVKYVYTDLSPVFTDYGREKFGDEYIFTEYRTLDLERNLESQGFDIGEFDIVIGSNVLHATRKIRNSLINAKLLLKTHGVLMLNELTSVQTFTTLTFGLLDGWWLFEDSEKRLPGSPLLGVEQWSKALASEGFENIKFLGSELNNEHGFSQHVILCESNGKQILEKNVTKINNSFDDLIHSQPKIDSRIVDNTVRNTLQKAKSSKHYRDILTLYIENIIISSLKLNMNQGFNHKRSLFDLGLDSLMSLELKNRVEKDLACKLSNTVFFDYSTVYDLVEYLMTDVFLKQIQLLPDSTQYISTIPRRGDDNNLVPLSYAQQRLWFLDQYEKDCSFYHVAAKVSISGDFDEDLLEKTFETIIQRHESLRTNFIEKNGVAFQLINNKTKWCFQKNNLSDMLYENAYAEITKLIKQQIHKPFSLADDSLIRTELYRVSDDQCVLFVNMHHIISDGHSVSVLLKEVSEIYKSYKSRSFASLPELQIQYADYSQWQHATYDECIKKQGEYWKNKLLNLSQLLMPVDYPRTGVQTYRGSSVKISINNEDHQALVLISKKCNATLFMTLLSAFNVLLHKYTSQTDVAVGSPIANRTHGEIESLIGFFVNTLVMRNEVVGEHTFVELLKQVKDTALAAYSNQDIPFEKVVDIVLPERDLSHSPLFQVMFMLRNSPDQKLNVSGVELVTEELMTDTSKFDLTLSLHESDSGLQGWFEFNTDLFKRDSIERLSLHFSELIKSIINNPEQLVSKLKILNHEEENRLIHVLGRPNESQNSDKGIHCLVEEVAINNADDVAVVFENMQLTYQQLNEKSNKLAHYLQSKGIKNGDKVSICIERSLELIVVILGVVKAGAVYVPIDSSYPPERILYMIENSQSELLLINGNTDINLTNNIEVIDVELNDEIEVCSSENTLIDITGNDLAYIMYTSGSTGEPKGVAIPHRGICRLVLASQFPFLNSGCRMLQYAPISFDASTFEIWGVLANGGTLCLCPPHQLSFDELGTKINQYSINTIWLTSGLFHTLVDTDITLLKGLKTVLAGGDVLSPSHVKRVLREVENITVINGYGPTENTTFTCVHTMTSVDQVGDSVSIGMPINATQVYILDDYANPVPTGVSGELYIGGDGLANGYFNNPSLTNEKFITDLFDNDSSDAFYKTGDVVRYLSNGTIEFIGRVDNQVKVRGYRIEPGEIETSLSNLNVVNDAVVLVCTNADVKHLVAYIVSNPEYNVTKDLLKNELKALLPDFMVPTIFIFLDFLPLTSNGKFDRNALPEPDFTTLVTAKDYVAARSNSEQLLVQVFQDVLDIERVSIHDNFFEIGGDSILVIQLISRLGQHGLRYTPQQFFQYQTIAALAGVAENISDTADQGLISGELPILPIQQWFFDRQLNDPHHWNQGVIFNLEQRIVKADLQAVMDAILLQHDALRLNYQQTNNGWHQSFNDAINTLKLETIDISQLSELEQTREIEVIAERVQSSLQLSHDARNKHDISQCTLARTVLFDRGLDTPQSLLMVVHHLVVDGVSWRILADDINRGLRQRQDGEAVELGRKTNSIQQWAHMLKALSQTGQLNAQRAYWQQLSEQSWPSIPKDFNSDENSVALNETLTVTLNEQQTRALLTNVNNAYHTSVNDILLSALSVIISDWQEQSSVLLIDMEGHGRQLGDEKMDVSRTLGWFTAKYPVGLELTKNASAGELIKSVKEQLRRIPDQGTGYGVLRYMHANASVHAALADVPKAQILFNYLGQFQTALGSQSLLSLGNESCGAMQSPRGNKSHLLEVNSMVVEGCLSINWSYSKAIHRKATISALANQYLNKLDELIEHCLNPQYGGYTPSDFPLSGLTQASLDQILSEKEQAGAGKIEAIYPLTPVQQGLLFHSLYAPQSSIYRVQLCCEIKDTLDIECFKQAWQLVVSRHPVLRSSLVWQDVELQTPLQCVHDTLSVDIQEHDWEQVACDDVKPQLEQFLAKENETAFDFSSPPLMQWHWLKLSNNHSWFVWHFHHILLDGWSVPLVLKEVFTSYAALLLGTEPRLGTVSKYESYVEWLDKQNYHDAESFWRDYLFGMETTPLPIRRNGHGELQAEYTQQSCELSEKLTNTLQQFARSNRITLNTVMQGAWSLLLSRYSGSTDIVFGKTVAGRPPSLTGIEDIVGMCINTLPIRVVMKANDRLVTWLQSLQDQQVKLQKFEALSLLEIQKWRDGEGNQELFDTVVVFENYPIDQMLRDRNLSIEIGEIKNIEQTNYALTLVVIPGEQLSLRLIYDQQDIATEMVKRLLNHLEICLSNMLENQAGVLSDIGILTEDEKYQQLVSWNDTQHIFDGMDCIHQNIEQQALLTPENIAVVFEHKSLTYRELNERANQLANYLLDKCVKAEDLIAICVERSLEMIVGILGILKAGAAYVPLDPNYPLDRLGGMLEDCDPDIILIQGSCTSVLPETNKVKLLLDAEWPLISKCSIISPNRNVLANHLAYVIYTSGSTGQPKGVMNEHGAVVNRLQWAQTQFLLNKKDVVLQKTPYSFDVSVWELFLPLMTGARLVIAKPGGHKDHQYLVDMIIEHKVTTIHFVPSMLQQIVSVEDFVKCDSLRNMISSGEELSLSLSKKFHQLLNIPIYNLYGPTEAAIDVSCYECNKHHSLDVVPIGKPIANTSLFILDKNLSPVPVGVAGDLYIGGKQVARGYLNKPELTHERFISNPFSSSNEHKLYKTGDIARYLTDGNIDYLGREDKQVKVRGFRIELGEIESAIQQQPGVKECVVVIHNDNNDNKQIVAYIVSNCDAFDKQKLSSVLPSYMLPSLYVYLESMPLTHNGKINKKALPEPKKSLFRDAEYVAARNDIEKILTELWSDVLDIERVSIHDNFFEIGGDSILVIQLISRLGQHGLRYTPQQFFQYQTIAALAGVAENISDTADQGLISGELPILPIQQWFFDRQLNDPHHWNQGVIFNLEQRIVKADLQAVMDAILLQHDALRLNYQQTNNGWHQSFNDAINTLKLETIDISQLSELEQTREIEVIAERVQSSLQLSHDARNKHDISQCTLARTVLFDRGLDTPQSLLMVVHHLVVDGVSWRILADDINRGLRQRQDGEAVELGRKTNSIQQWAHMLKALSQTGQLNAQRAYWQQLSEQSWPSIPKDFNSDENSVALNETLTVTLNEQQTRALLTNVNNAYHTSVNDILLSALSVIISDWQEQSSVLLIDMEGHGRQLGDEKMDVSRTLGWFTAKYPVGLELTKNASAGELIKSVKEQLRRIPDQGTGYGVLRYMHANASVHAALADVPKAQILFNYLGQFQTALGSQSLLSLGNESCGAMQSPRGNKSHLLEVNSMVVEGCLSINWSYSKAIHRKATISALANQYLNKLDELIEHCLNPQYGGYTPSDFPLSGLTQASLDQILSEKEQAGAGKIEAIYPLTPVQQGLLFHSLYAPQSSIYRVQLCCEIKDTLDIECFKQAWQLVVSRHPVLRSSLVWQDVELQTPLQCVHDTLSVDIQEHDWEQVACDDVKPQLEQFLAKENETAFDFSSPPLMQWHWLKLSNNHSWFVWHFHHILLDGWSVPLVLKEVFTSYAALLLGTEPRLGTVSKYESYVEWLDKQNYHDAESFWRDYLFGMETTPLPIRRNGHGELQAEYTQQSCELSEKLTNTLQQFARSNRITLNTVMQGAWSLLLSRYSGSTDIVFGKTVAGRPPSLTGIEDIVGMCINTLPIRVVMKANDRLVTWLQSLQDQQVKLQKFEALSLLEIQKWRDGEGNQELFDTVVVFENYPIDQMLRDRNLSIEIGEIKNIEQTNYALTLVVIPGEQLSLRLIYDQQDIATEMVKRLLNHLEICLSNMLENQAGVLSDIGILTEDEKYQQLVSWNDVLLTKDHDESVNKGALLVHEIFENRVKETPDAIAVVFGEKVMTYNELNILSNRLAHYLIDLGITTDILVGLCVDHSFNMVIGQLAILKAGAAYLPIDVDYPQSRIDYMIKDSAITQLITVKSLQERFHILEDKCSLICIDSEEKQDMFSDYPEVNVDIKRYKANDLDKNVRQLAYVIYTSGSTGVPKGVMVDHRGIERLVNNNRYINISAEDRVAQLSNISFDAATFEVWGALLNGASLVLFDYEQILTPDLFRAKIESSKISICFITTALFNRLIDADSGMFSSLKYLLFGGEICDLTKVNKLFENGKPEHLLHVYGPTENTTFSTYFEIEELSSNAFSIPIGKPISESTAYILDENMNPLPIGITGELYMGGNGLARGYLNNAVMTAEKFVPNPHSSVEGGLLYKTGDLASFDQMGNIEFRGRMDNQLKIKGFRIEPGEIESLLSTHSLVKNAIVSIVIINGSKRLAAYIETDVTVKNIQAEELFGASEEYYPQELYRQLQQYLKVELPEYMIPVAFAAIDQFPLTSNGKVDHTALPIVQLVRVNDVAYITPETPQQIAISKIWVELLGIEKTGLQDNFFDIGGDSLLATQFVTRVKHSLNVEISIRNIFENPLLVDISLLVSKIQKDEKGQARMSRPKIKSRKTIKSEQEFLKLNELSDDELKQMLQVNEDVSN